jgi:CO dehydrogenase/acetyl-CoA synthase gamma subunit (corrinoid Fe-S protein)
MEITQARVKELFDYHPDGHLTWKVQKSNNVKVGSFAGSVNSEGYLQVGIDRVLYKVHRLIYLWHYGFVYNLIDHIDQNKLNNKIQNLRIATNSQNLRNRSKQVNNTSGFKGVSFHKHTNKFQAKIKINKKQIYLGLFLSAEEAYDVYCIAAKKYHKEFWSL